MGAARDNAGEADLQGHGITPSDQVRDELAQRLFNAWVLKLSADRLEVTEYGSGSSDAGVIRTFGDPAGSHFVLHERGLSITVAKIVELDESVVAAVVEEAVARVAAGDHGQGVVYRVEMTVRTPEVVFGDGLHLMRVLGDQVHIEGSRRLANAVILDFEQGLLDSAPLGGLLLAPTSKVQATIFAPGPVHSDFSLQTAVGVAALTAAVCALATGRPVRHTPPIFSADDEETADAFVRRGDPSIPGLARDSISLDVFGDLAALGGGDALLRVRGALLAYQAALEQASPDVAVMLFVTAFEALISPRAPWGKSKVTQRFVRALTDLCPEAIDQLVGHDNVETAFNYRRRGEPRRQRRELLNAIYEARSLPTHNGLNPSLSSMFSASGDAQGMRVALLSDLSRAAILAYFCAPRSSLIGHPVVDPPGASH